MILKKRKVMNVSKGMSKRMKIISRIKSVYSRLKKFYLDLYLLNAKKLIRIHQLKNLVLDNRHHVVK